MMDMICFTFLKVTLSVVWVINCIAAEVEVVRPRRELVQKTKGRWRQLGLTGTAVEVLGSRQTEDASDCKADMLLDS